MQRKHFLQSLAWLTGVLFFSRCAPARALRINGKTLKGSVVVKGTGLKDVVVSDGYSVIATDKNGRFGLELHPEATALFISTPAGYSFINENGIARHYRLLQEVGVEKEIRFGLTALERDDNEHQFVIWADPQVANANDVEKMMTQSVPDVQKLVTAAGTGTLLHGITVGDIVWDKPELFAEYNKAVKQMGIPFFQCLGNHDMDYRKGGDETSDKTFKSMYGPTYYSFSRGKVHYVVLDDVLYLGHEREYKGFITEAQLAWLKKDLSFVPKNNLLVICAHIPVHAVENKQALYDVVQGYNVHIMTGHTHINSNIIKDNVYEHVQGTVCGAWWTGPVCGDGTPPGYAVYEVKGTAISWHYKSVGQQKSHQIRTIMESAADGEQELFANVWNWDPAWKVEWRVDGVGKGELPRNDDFDPLAVSLYKGAQLPKSRPFVEPKKTEHAFRVKVPKGAKEIRVVATDRFGNTYEAIA